MRSIGYPRAVSLTAIAVLALAAPASLQAQERESLSTIADRIGIARPKGGDAGSVSSASTAQAPAASHPEPSQTTSPAEARRAAERASYDRMRAWLEERDGAPPQSGRLPDAAFDALFPLPGSSEETAAGIRDPEPP